MSDDLQSKSVGERLAGKWQIPAFVIGLAALTTSIVTYRSPIDKIPFDRLRDELPGLIEDGRYTAAIEAAEHLFLVPEKTPEALGSVHAALGRARLLRALRGGAEVPSIGRAVVEHYRQAAEGGYELTAVDHEVVGRAYDWVGEFGSAVTHYDVAIALSDGADLDLRWRSAELHADVVPTSAAGIHEILDGLIRDASDRPDVVVWALERKVDLLSDVGDFDGARELLKLNESRLVASPWREWGEYLGAYLSYRSGAHEGVEARLRDLRSRLGLRDELYARTGWLLGRMVLGTDGPERPVEAISFFLDVMSVHSAPLYATAAQLGLAESLVALNRFDEALDRYAGVMSEMNRLPASRHLSPRVIESSLTVVSDRLRRDGLTETAVRFARLAVLADEGGPARRRFLVLERLSDLLAVSARERRALADELSGEGSSEGAGLAERIASLRDEARSLLLESGEVGMRLADLVAEDLERSASLGWRAAERIHESGALEKSIETMVNYVVRWPSSPYVPRALRYQGLALQALGRLEEAVDVFQQNLRRYGRTPDGGGSLIPLARCYIAMGKDYADLAEKTLRLVLNDSDVFTPQAPEFADALFLLGELLNRSGSYERAVPELEEAMKRYPNDARTTRARFLLGDCYRQSAMALDGDLADATFAAQRQRMQTERVRRLRQAAELFGQTVAKYESRTDGLDELDEVYLRHARLYRADCHFELGEYDEALSHYERAGWVYKGTTTALAAYVQIINCHFFMGRGADAAAALRRALYLVDTIPEDVFAGDIGGETRQDWRGYFEWVEKSGLF